MGLLVLVAVLVGRVGTLGWGTRILEVLVGLRERIAAELTATMHGGDLELERYAGPPGDPGLFGIAPGDPVWRVHGQATGMLTGGFAALMLQSLHPLAMAGVDQHSDFRADPVGRLNGIVRFITTTTFGSSAAAREVIDVVRRIHTRVHGTAPDGRPYRADDPDLLTWVHTAEVRSFLAGHQTYAPRALRLAPAACDAYYRQVAPVAEALGARNVPRTCLEVERYLARLRPQLHATPAALDSVLFLRRFGRTRRERLVVGLLMNASVGLLPDWARAELGIHRPAPVRTGWDRPLATAVGHILQWGLGPSPIQAAARGGWRGRGRDDVGIFDAVREVVMATGVLGADTSGPSGRLREAIGGEPHRDVPGPVLVTAVAPFR